MSISLPVLSVNPISAFTLWDQPSFAQIPRISSLIARQFQSTIPFLPHESLVCSAPTTPSSRTSLLSTSVVLWVSTLSVSSSMKLHPQSVLNVWPLPTSFPPSSLSQERSAFQEPTNQSLSARLTVPIKMSVTFVTTGSFWTSMDSTACLLCTKSLAVCFMPPTSRA